MWKPYFSALSVVLLAGGAMGQSSAPAASAASGAPSPQGDAQSSPPQGADPQQPGPAEGPAFKSSTRIVVVDLVVTDKRGAPVPGLKQSDFRVLENGHEQTVKVFEEHTNVGLGPYIRPQIPTEPGVTAGTNAGQESRGVALSVILFDALNTASSDQSFARQQVKKVIADLPPGSRIAIFTLRGGLHMVQGFTTDPTLLAKAMDNNKSTLSGEWFNDPDMVLLSNGGDPLGTSSTASAGSILSGNGAPSGNMGPQTFLGSTAQRDEEAMTSDLRTKKTLAALAELAARLSMLPGKKDLYWLAGSFPFDLMPDTSATPGTNVPDAFRGNISYNSVLHDLAMQMEAGHIAVSPVDVRGLTLDGSFNAAGGARPTFNSITSAAGAQLSQEEVMENLAHQTGGRAIYNDNDIKGEIIESLNQGENFYTVAYSPADKNWNGKYRKIEIKTELKDVKMYYRRGYLADDPGKPGKEIVPESVPKFAVAMLRGAPERAEVGLTVKASGSGTYIDEKERKPPSLKDRKLPFETHLKGTTEVYALDCVVDAKTVSFTKTQAGLNQPSLAFTLLAYDADGTILNAETGMFAQPLNDAQYQAVLKHGLTVRQQMELPLGHVYLRVGVHDLQKDKVGATELPLLVTGKQTAAISTK